MIREAVDFHFVPDRQMKVHEALLNWARSMNGRPKQAVSASCSGYQSPPAVRSERDSPVPVDHIGARKVNSMVIALPIKHCKSLQWHYVMRSSIAAGRRYVVCTTDELAALVIDARDMLKNQGLR